MLNSSQKMKGILLAGVVDQTGTYDKCCEQATLACL